MYWLVLPAIDVEPDLRPMDLLALLGVLSALVAGAAREAGKKNLIPTKDPRLEQSLVFEKFYRGRNQRVSVHGTGMGLAICKAIVEAHGGSLGLTSQLGHGSVFYFSLPVA